MKIFLEKKESPLPKLLFLQPINIVSMVFEGVYVVPDIAPDWKVVQLLVSPVPELYVDILTETVDVQSFPISVDFVVEMFVLTKYPLADHNQYHQQKIFLFHIHVVQMFDSNSAI
jgi:hypothetical protein